jgi:hypothetical protein
LFLKAPPYLRWATSHEKGEIFQRLLGLQYRLEKHNRGLDAKPPDQELLVDLKKWAVQWKRDNPLLGAPVLTLLDVEILNQAACYPEFVRLIQESENVRESFFVWCLRDGNHAQAFIEFPGVIKKLIQSKISSRLGQFSQRLLWIEKKATFTNSSQDSGERGKTRSKLRGLTEEGMVRTMSDEEDRSGEAAADRIPDEFVKVAEKKASFKTSSKELLMLFEGKPVSILDPTLEVRFRGGYVLSIEKILEIFFKKDWEVGNLEVFANGIENWNIHHLGYWNQEEKVYVKIEINEESWWLQLPLFLKLSRQQLIQRYKLNIKAGDWVAAAVATRGRSTLDFEETHAFLEVAVPYKEDYLIYDFGKLAFIYPKSSWQRISMMTKTVHATVAYPDENVYYTHRQKGFYPLLLNPSQGEVLMNKIKDDIVTSRKRNLVYQIESENCAKWVYSSLVDAVGMTRVPDLFRMSLLDTEPLGLIAWAFKAIKMLPQSWQVPVLAFLHLPLGATRKVWVEEDGKKVPKSLVLHPFFRTGQVFLPALLIAKASQLSPLMGLGKFCKRYFNSLKWGASIRPSSSYSNWDPESNTEGNDLITKSKWSQK